MSERRACKLIGCNRMTVRYRSRRPDDPKLRERLRALAHERRRFGYRSPTRARDSVNRAAATLALHGNAWGRIL